MGVQKQTLFVYSQPNKTTYVSKPANILHLLKKNKEDLKREKRHKIYVLSGLIVLTFIFCLYLFL